MATLKLVVLALACSTAYGFPQDQPTPRTTIFAEETIEGEVFGYLNSVQAFNEGPNAALFRLPTTTRPIHYDVLWGIDIGNLAFSGTVAIQLAATQAGVNEIVIHSEDLTIGTVTLQQGTTTVASSYVLEPDFQFLRVSLTTGSLEYNADNPVVYTLTVTFEAPLRTDMYGIYRSWYRNNASDTEVSWMASTQFQATSSRKAFPCYDEPSFKATFDITISRPVGFSSWSCTRINTTTTSNTPNYENDVYHTTPLMSTYLLALIVAEYDNSLNVTDADGNLIYEVIARPGAISDNQGQYAFEVGQELLAEMNDHTAIDFYSVNPNIKMTQASIPDFSAGAMENWGLLTYREAYIMYHEEHTNSYFKQLIAYILSHEIAHMWFGNLVTNDWWDVLWLNEGFARYYQYFLTHWVEDYMGLETRFITEQVHVSLLSDSVDSAHPLTTTNIGSPAAVSGMFSTLSYNKGAAIIRMTEHLLGFEIHRQGLRNYLTANAFGTVLPIHLFQALQDVGDASGTLLAYGSDFSVIDYYRTWTEQAGHPVLNVHVNHETGDMTIHQRRFNINSGYSNINTNWIIPITFTSASAVDFNNTKPTHIISKAVTVINRGVVGDEWVIFNKQQTGYYRVNYDDYTWDLITLALRGADRTRIHEYNRAQIVNDVFQFARSGIMSYTKALNILSFLEYETSYAPWVAAMTGFTWLRNRLAGTEYLAELEGLIANWATVVMADLTYYPTADPEDFMRSYLRYQLAPIMCQINRDTCRTAAVAQFNNLQNNNVEVPVDSRNWVYCNALREGNAATYNYLWNRFLEHNVYTEKIQLIMVLGCTNDATSLNSFLNAILQENQIIRPQDYTTAFNSAVTGNEENTQLVFQYIQNNLNLVLSAFNSPLTPLSYITSRLRTEAEIQEFEQWATANAAVLGDSYNNVMSSANSARTSIQWTNTVINDMNNFFDNGYQEVELTTAAPVTTLAPVTEIRPDLIQPETPTLPSSAATSFLSMSAVIAVAFAKYFA